MVDTDDTRRTTAGVWHKLPKGELKIFKFEDQFNLENQGQGHKFSQSYQTFR